MWSDERVEVGVRQQVVVMEPSLVTEEEELAVRSRIAKVKVDKGSAR